MMKINEIATAVAHREGGKEPQSIAQISEAIRCLADELAANPEAKKAWDKYVAAKRRVIVLEQDVVNGDDAGDDDTEDEPGGE